MVSGATAGAHIELLPTAPRFNSLDTILEASSYSAQDEEASDAQAMPADSTPRGKGYSFDQLLARVQVRSGYRPHPLL